MKNKIKVLALQKKVWIPVVVLAIILFFVFNGKSNEDVTVITPTYGELTQSVRATGQVTSKTELNLSFKKQGTVSAVNVSVGDKVKKGATLASLDSSDAYAQITQARGALLAAEARLKRILEGSTNEEVMLARVALENSKKDYENIKSQQQTLVNNALNNLFNSGFEAEKVGSSDLGNTPTISGTYVLAKEGDLNVNVYNTGSGLKFFVSGLTTGEGTISSTTPQPLGNSGLYILFTSTSNLDGSNWNIKIPNKNSSTYLANKNAYDSALKTQQSAYSSALSLIDQKTAELALKQAQARTSDVELAEADIVSAKGGLQRAQANYEDNIIRSPASGTITKVDIKYGEISEMNKTAIVLQDVGNLYVEALINESNIANIKIDQDVDITFDALGPATKFTGKVSHIDPSSVTTEGVVNYKIKVSIIEPDQNIRPGMNAEITVVTSKKAEVVYIPFTAVTKRDGKNYVNIIVDENKKTYKEQEVSIGLEGDGNQVEIISGISTTDKIALVVEK